MPVSITITMGEDGSLCVDGAIENKLLAYGLLECAKDAINEHANKAKNLVQPVTLMPPPSGILGGGPRQ